MNLDAPSSAAYLSIMKIETDAYVKLMLLILVVCAVLVTYKYMKGGGVPKLQASGLQVPPTPTASAPRNPIGFMPKV
jgi:hypothetical protein